MVGKPNMQLNPSQIMAGLRKDLLLKLGTPRRAAVSLPPGEPRPPLHTPELCEQKTPADVSIKGILVRAATRVL